MDVVVLKPDGLQYLLFVVFVRRVLKDIHLLVVGEPTQLKEEVHPQILRDRRHGCTIGLCGKLGQLLEVFDKMRVLEMTNDSKKICWV